MNAADDLVAVALLAEPVRQRLYLFLRDYSEPAGREEVSARTGIAPRLAAFHLDRMADAGLLEVEYRRLSGRTGPGAGRPSKLYRIAAREFSVLIPQTRYALAASMMATALSAAGPGTDGAGSLQEVAGTAGERLGEELRRQERTRGARLEAVRRQLTHLGYEPREEESGAWTLRNCIFAELSASHRELVCAMNAAFVTGLLSGARIRSLSVQRQEPGPACCVQLAGRKAASA